MYHLPLSQTDCVPYKSVISTHTNLGDVVVALLLYFSPLILVLIHTWRSRKKSSDNTQNIPKGSSGWPFIGEPIPFLKPHPSIHMSPFMEQRISKYGKIFRSRLPGRQVIFSGDTELNRIVLQNTGQMIKSDRPSTFVGLFGKFSIVAISDLGM
ncbi:Cytochrome P450 90B1 [Acorus gramineus]|uniref:Cytochrome P450 90B1 n=1 Tax=Acorus gramineus TaxID=55184 RepID=A0AAV9BKZ2_ACOGR|nr:Cytochrome P450 90B1 [Acorus gramineus]